MCRSRGNTAWCCGVPSFCAHRLPLFEGVLIVVLRSRCGLWAVPSCPCSRSRSVWCRHVCLGGSWPLGSVGLHFLVLSSCPCSRRSAQPRHPHLPPSACGSYGCSHLRTKPCQLPNHRLHPKENTPPPPALTSHGPQSSCLGWGGLPGSTAPADVTPGHWDLPACSARGHK